MYEKQIHEDFVLTRAPSRSTVVEMVRSSIDILNDPHAPQQLKDRQLTIVLHIKQLIDSYLPPAE